MLDSRDEFVNKYVQSMVARVTEAGDLEPIWIMDSDYDTEYGVFYHDLLFGVWINNGKTIDYRDLVTELPHDGLYIHKGHRYGFQYKYNRQFRNGVCPNVVHLYNDIPLDHWKSIWNQPQKLEDVIKVAKTGALCAYKRFHFREHQAFLNETHIGHLNDDGVHLNADYSYLRSKLNVVE